jgi:4-amino-4-deoxy-L-arabinose transferase-like glycosyltransferase
MRPVTAVFLRTAPIALALASVLALAQAIAVFHATTRPRLANGFLRLETPGASCETTPAWERRAHHSIDPEPFIPEGEAPEQCVVWRSYWAVARPTRLEIELECDDDGVVMLDEHRLVQLPGMHGRATRTETSDVAPGVHLFEVRSTNRGGGAYLRVRMQDRRDSYMAGVLPLDRDQFYVSRGDAERALAAARPARRQPERALEFALFLAAAGVLGWLAVRSHRRRHEAPLHRFALVDLGLALAVSAVALAIRSGMVADTDLAWDELWYWNAGEHYVRNAMLGDWTAESFRWNHEHPPIAKWIYGLGGALGGIDGARQVGCVLSAASVGLTYGIGRVLFDRRAAFAAGLVLAGMPHVVAHGRLVGLETVVVFFWCANLLALAIWMKSVSTGGDDGRRLIPGDRLAAGMGAFVFFPGLLARLTYLWMFPVVVLGVVYARRKQIARGTIPIPAESIWLGSVSLMLCIALWPWIHTDPTGHLSRTFEHWGGRVPTEYFLGERLVGPPFEYYPVIFVVTTPLLAVLAAIVGAGLGVREKRTRMGAWLVIVALLMPFLQGLSSFRQDLARYVIQSWPAIALLAGVAMSHAGRALALAARAPRGGRTAVAYAPALALSLYVAAELRGVEPFPLDYYSELVGGPGVVAQDRLFDVSWWAEGVGHATEWLNEHAREGARVRMDVSNWDVRPRLRDDLVEVQFRSQVPAEYVVVNYHLYGDPPPRGCTRIHLVEVRGAPLASVYECPHEARREAPR